MSVDPSDPLPPPDVPRDLRDVRVPAPTVSLTDPPNPNAGATRPDDEELLRCIDVELHDLLALDEALERLAAVHPELARLVELNFFGGRSLAECAEVLGISERRAFRRWQAARAFLHREVGQ